MKINVLYIVLIVFLISCKPDDVVIEENRNFHMGVTPWPGNFTLSDLDIAYDFINNHCDIVSHHFDEGIPYEEAFNNQTMPIELQQQIEYRNAKTNDDKKILLSIAALDLTRKSKAEYHDKSLVSNAIKQEWMTKDFNDATVITAYINYVNYLINAFNPNYVNFGVESNVETFEVLEFAKYKDFIAQVYASLKATHPNLPLL
ncbi:MAG: hypothetical protein HC854_12085 [Flavobacterium sp.]|nr:hypothetical protein [Flavobacterium sp.]